MKALEKSAPGPGHVQLTDTPCPEPGAGQVLIEVTGAGVCGTDLHIRDASFTTYPPVTMGHEVTGVVRETGAGVEGGWHGARVVCETFHSTCGVCPWCRDGRPNLCPDRRSIGSGANGGFAPLMTLPARNLHRVPDRLDEHAAALCEPLACVCQSLADPGRVGPGDDVLVTGPGTMGLLAAQVARAAGGRVTISGTARDQVRLEAARGLGFATADAADTGAFQALGGGHGPAVVIECSGSGRAMATGLSVVRRGGRYVQIGQTGDDVTVPLALVSLHEISISGGFASTPHSWRRAMALLEAGAIELAPLVSEVCALDEWERVFADTEAARGIKYVFDPRR